jgi:hypothetical protein
MEEKKRVTKYYNPYPFMVRVLNDLKKKQTLAPQAHCKVKGGKYDQSPLELLPLDKRAGKKYRKGLEINLRRLQKKDLIDLAWAVMVGKMDELEKLSQKDLIKGIEEQTGEKVKGTFEKELGKEPEEETEPAEESDEVDQNVEGPSIEPVIEQTYHVDSGEDSLPTEIDTGEEEEKEPKPEEKPVEQKRSGRKKIDLDEKEEEQEI